MASTVDLSNLYNELNKACNSSAYAKVINISNKILAKKNDDFKVTQCKVVALIHSEKYEECLSVIKKSGAYAKILLFERAYLEYRLNRISDALKTLETADQDDLRVKELLAQVLYRAERFEESHDMLCQVIRDSQDDYEEERITNLIAAAASAACWQNVEINVEKPDGMYESAYNLACYYLGRREYDLALEILDEAEEKCKEMMGEDPDVNEEEIEEELAPIRVQRAYIYQLLDKEREAYDIYQNVSKQRTNDLALLAVTANNIVSINREQNIFDSRKRIKMASTEKLEAKLFSQQILDLQLNQALFYWHTNQLEACRTKMKALTSQYPFSPRVALINAVQLLKERKQTRVAAKILEQYWSQSVHIVCPDSEQGLPPALSNAESVAHLNSTSSKAAHEVNERLCIPLTAVQLYLAHQDESSGNTSNVKKSLRNTVGLTDAALEAFTANLATISNQLETSLNINTSTRQLAQLPGILGLRVGFVLLSNLSAADKTTVSTNQKRVYAASAIASARQLIETALEQHESGQVFGGKFYLHLLDACSSAYLRLGCAPDAARLLEKQLEHFDNNESDFRNADQLAQSAKEHERSSLVTRLVEALSHFDESKAATVAAANARATSQVCDDSDNVVQRLSEQDTDALESAFLFGPKYLKRMQKTGVGAVSPSGEANVTPDVDCTLVNNASTARRVNAEQRRERARIRQRKRRQVKLPAGAQLGTLPDPERWLPRRERQHGRGKRSGRDRRADATRGLARGPQGSTSGGTEWDASTKTTPKTEMSGTQAKQGGGAPVPQSNVKNYGQKKSHKKRR